MGIAIAILYLPLLFLAILLARSAAKFLLDHESETHRSWLWFLGLALGCLLTWIAIQSVDVRGNQDYDAFLKMVGLSLVIPLVIGVFFILFGSTILKFTHMQVQKYCFYRVAVGSMHATWALPLLFFVFEASGF